MYGDVTYDDISIQSVDRAPAVPCEIAMRLSSAKLEDMLRKKKKVKMKDQTHGLRRDDGQAGVVVGGGDQAFDQQANRRITDTSLALFADVASGWKVFFHYSSRSQPNATSVLKVSISRQTQAEAFYNC